MIGWDAILVAKKRGKPNQSRAPASSKEQKHETSSESPRSPENINTEVKTRRQKCIHLKICGLTAQAFVKTHKDDIEHQTKTWTKIQH